MPIVNSLRIQKGKMSGSPQLQDVRQGSYSCKHFFNPVMNETDFGFLTHWVCCKPLYAKNTGTRKALLRGIQDIQNTRWVCFLFAIFPFSK